MFLLSSYQTSKKSIVIRLSSIFIVVMALVIALYGVTYLIKSPFELSDILPVRKLNFLVLKGALAKSLLWKTGFTIHVIGGSIGLVLGSFQFFYRSKNALMHRIAGTCYASAILCSSTAGLYLSYFASVSRMGIICFFVTDICWFVNTWLGVQAVRRKDKTNHKKWFLRSFSFTLVVVSFRILFQVFFNGQQYDFNTSYVLGIWLSLSFNIVVTEFIIFKKYATNVQFLSPTVKQPKAFTSIIELPVTIYSDTSGSAHININAIAFSSSGRLWGIDFYFRLVYFDTLTNAVTVFQPVASVNFLQEFTVNSLLVEGEDVFWISTAHDGLFRYDKRSGKTIHYTYDESPGSLPTNQLMNMVQDPIYANILWIGSMGGGLIKFDKTTGKCQAFTISDGLPNNTVYAVTIDANGILWCSSNKGIFSFGPITLAVQGFLSKDGLPGDEFIWYHFLQLPDSRIAFGGVDGYTVFNPLHVADDTFQPPVALTGIRINNMPADFGYPASHFKAAINSLNKIVLPYTQNFLTFEFAALEYNIIEKLQYRYKLVGLDETWVAAGNDNNATYTRITPGHYTLMINATNTAGKWSTYVKTLSVVIEPPFWKTGWFTALWIGAVAAFIYFLIHYRIAAVRKEEQQKAFFEREAFELKAQALRAQMNPHFIFNCLNSIKALIQEDNKQQAVNYLTTFSKLIRSQLHNAEREISLYDELQTCKLYTQLEALRFGAKITCTFITDENVDTHSVQVPPLILQSFIENAIWHGILPKGGGRVTVSVTGQDDVIQCAIEDDGIGREMALRNKSGAEWSTYESKGMKLVQGRLNLHNIINNRGSSIQLIDKKDASGCVLGTLVIVRFKKETL